MAKNMERGSEGEPLRLPNFPWRSGKREERGRRFDRRGRRESPAPVDDAGATGGFSGGGADWTGWESGPDEQRAASATTDAAYAARRAAERKREQEYLFRVLDEDPSGRRPGDPPLRGAVPRAAEVVPASGFSPEAVPQSRMGDVHETEKNHEAESLTGSVAELKGMVASLREEVGSLRAMIGDIAGTLAAISSRQKLMLGDAMADHEETVENGMDVT